jgi:hypothetical protein
MHLINLLSLRWVQFFDHVKINGWKTSLKDIFCLYRKAKIIVRDLNGMAFDTASLEKNDMLFAEISKNEFDSGKLRFEFNNRKLKAGHYLKDGYRGFCVLKNDVVIGDTWFFEPNKKDPQILHKDITLLKIPWDMSYVYSFDTFLAPKHRGNFAAKGLFNNALFSMAEKGYKKAYGYYWEDNFPAIWNAKVINKFKEVGAMEISRILFWRFSRKG